MKQDKLTFNRNAVVNIYIVYDINFWPFKYSCDFTLKNSLFGSVKLTKNIDPDKYKYPGYGIGFDMSGAFLLYDGKNYCWYEFICTYW